MQVSPLRLGSMMFGSVGGSGAGNPDHDACTRMVHVALDAGINFVDTADMYSAGESEEIVGRALQGRRDDVILASKFHFPLSEGPNRSGNSRRHIVRAVEASLRRLNTDYLDLYQIHRPDETTDIEETLWALTGLVQDGKIRAFGSSTFPAHEIVRSHWVSERRGLMRLRTEQPPNSLLSRAIETELLPVCHQYGMGVLTWSPLAFGFLSGKHRKGKTVDLTTGRPRLNSARFAPETPGNTEKYDALEAFIELADSLGVTLPELAIAFPIAHPAVTSVIIGPRTPKQLEATIAGAHLALDDQTLDRIDEIVPPGRNVHQRWHDWPPEALTKPLLRRRPYDERAAQTVSLS